MSDSAMPPRDLAIWSAALKELESRRFAQMRSPTSFLVTNDGYKENELLTKDSPIRAGKVEGAPPV
jgi:hypothetical protein